MEKYGKVFPGCNINNVSSIFSRFYAFGGCYKHSIDGVLIHSKFHQITILPGPLYPPSLLVKSSNFHRFF